MGEEVAEHCGELCGSHCQHLLQTGSPSPQGLVPLGEKKRVVHEVVLGQGLWRKSTQSKMMGEETCCSRKSGRSWNCIWGQSCWSSHRPCPCPSPYLGLCPCPCPDRGCFFCGCCCCGGCVNGGGCGVSGGRGHQTASPSCLADSPCHPCDLSGGGNDGNGTWRKNWFLAGGKMTSWSQSPQPRTAPLSLCHAPGPYPCQTLGADYIGQ